MANTKSDPPYDSIREYQSRRKALEVAHDHDLQRVTSASSTTEEAENLQWAVHRKFDDDLRNLERECFGESLVTSNGSVDSPERLWAYIKLVAIPLVEINKPRGSVVRSTKGIDHELVKVYEYARNLELNAIVPSPPWPELLVDENLFALDEIASRIEALCKSQAAQSVLAAKDESAKGASEEKGRNAIPFGWEGPPPDFEIATLVDLNQWIEQAMVNYPLFRDNPTVYVKDAALDCGRQVLRNAWRVLRKLSIQNAPQQPVEPSNQHDAEREIGNLQQWIFSRLESSTNKLEDRNTINLTTPTVNADQFLLREQQRLPTSIQILSDQQLKQQLTEVWTAANQLIATIDLWQTWFRQLRNEGDADPGLPLRYLETAERCVHVLCAQRAQAVPFDHESVQNVLKMLPMVPDGFKGGIVDEWDEEGKKWIQIERPPWQKDQVLYGSYYGEDGGLHTTNRLRAAALYLKKMLEEFPMTVVTPAAPAMSNDSVSIARTKPIVTNEPLTAIPLDTATELKQASITGESGELVKTHSIDSKEQSGSPVQFAGGLIKFFTDRVELCGVDICRGPRSEPTRKVLDLLRKRNDDGTFVAYSGKQLAKLTDRKGGENSMAGLIRDLRAKITEVLRNNANIECGPEDVIRSGGHGYRLNENLIVQDGDQKRPEINMVGDQTSDVRNVRNVRNDGVRNVRDGDVRNVRDDEASARQKWIRERLAAGNELQAPHVAKQFKCSVKTAQRDLQALKDEGQIEFIGSPRTGYYRIVPKMDPN